MGRCRKNETIAELLKTGVKKLEYHTCPWLLRVVHGVGRVVQGGPGWNNTYSPVLQAVENAECVVFVSERVVGTLASVLEGAPGNQDTCNYSLIDFEY